jgi:demethylmenaquinone methyltransferase/2-methoxy-6-polyprenyl-1,4-benzoquinol methylase
LEGKMTGKRRIEEMIAYYERRAVWHDHYMSFTDHDSMADLLRPIVEFVRPLVSGRSVLEIACGTGNWTGLLARFANSVLAVDSSATSLEIARRKLDDCANVTLRRGDAYDLKHPAGRSDVAFAADFLSHVPKERIPQLVESLRQQLAEDALVVSIDMLARPELEAGFSGTDRYGNRIYRRELPDGSQYDVIKNFPGKEELIEILAPWSDDVVYKEFPDLRRWAVTFRFR